MFPNLNQKKIAKLQSLRNIWSRRSWIAHLLQGNQESRRPLVRKNWMSFSSLRLSEGKILNRFSKNMRWIPPREGVLLRWIIINHQSSSIMSYISQQNLLIWFEEGKRQTNNRSIKKIESWFHKYCLGGWLIIFVSWQKNFIRSESNNYIRRRTRICIWLFIPLCYTCESFDHAHAFSTLKNPKYFGSLGFQVLLFFFSFFFDNWLSCLVMGSSRGNSIFHKI